MRMKNVSQAFKICLENLINLIAKQMSCLFFLFLSLPLLYFLSLLAFTVAIYLDLAELKVNMEEEVPLCAVNSYAMT